MRWQLSLLCRCDCAAPCVSKFELKLCFDLFTVMTQHLDVSCVLLSTRPRHVPYEESSVLCCTLQGCLFIIIGHMSTRHLSTGHVSCLFWAYRIPARLGKNTSLIQQAQQKEVSSPTFHFADTGQRVPAPRGWLLTNHKQIGSNIWILRFVSRRLDLAPVVPVPQPKHVRVK